MIIADLASVSRVHGGRTIFRDLSWALQDGEKIGLVGPSGWGKTTLLKAIAGIEDIEGFYIGHSIMARALFVGLDRAVRDMVHLINNH